MDPVDDEFLTVLAGISASLICLFLVGMILYIQTGFDREQRTREVVEPYAPEQDACFEGFVAAPAAPGEVAFTIWLLWKGIDVSRWYRRLHGSLPA